MGLARRRTAINLIWLKMRKGLKLREVAWSSQAEPLRLRAMYLCGLISERSGSRKDGADFVQDSSAEQEERARCQTL